MPEEVTIMGSVITARFHVPVPPLRLDTIMVTERASFGFEYSDDCLSSSIVSVEIVGDDEVRITLSNAPSCDNSRLRYAYTGVVGAWTGRHVNGAIGGNLRDSDSTLVSHIDGALPADFSERLENWCVSFDEPVVVEGVTAMATREKSAVGMKVWPNPTNSDVYVGLPHEAHGARFHLRTMDGRLVSELEVLLTDGTVYWLRWPDCIPGTYQLSCVVNEQIMRQRLMILD